MEMTTRYL